MAGKARTDWRKFKKNNKEFVESKAFKAKLGPNFDKFEKAEANLEKAELMADKALAAYVNAAKVVSGSLSSYEAIVKAIDKKELTDAFAEFGDYIESLPETAAKIKAHREHYWSELEDEGVPFAIRRQ